MQILNLASTFIKKEKRASYFLNKAAFPIKVHCYLHATSIIYRDLSQDSGHVSPQDEATRRLAGVRGMRGRGDMSLPNLEDNAVLKDLPMLFSERITLL